MRKLSAKSDSFFAVFKDSQISPVKVVFNVLGKNKITFSDGSNENATCLNCLSPLCTFYEEDEITLKALPEMPYNNSNKVCPTDAITSDHNGFPTINENQCIGCGMCISRCPYGAIEWEEKKAKISRSDSQMYTWVKDLSKEDFITRNRKFLEATHEIISSSLSKEFFTGLYKLTIEMCKKINGFDNLFVRNLLINIGLKNKVRAVGNNDIRFDLLGEFDNKIIVGEIGLNGIDILEEPRALLDDVAILIARYQIEKRRLIPIIVTLTFPNKRSDVYEVIADIKKILAIEIKTLPFHLLIILNLCQTKIDLSEFFELFNINIDNTSSVEDAISLIQELKSIDPLLGSSFYQAAK